MTQDRKILLPDAPNFSRFLEETFEGAIEVTDVKMVRQGFISKRGRLLSCLIGPDYSIKRIDEDRFLQLQEKFPEVKSQFIGPFYKCCRTNLTFRIPETPELTLHREMLKREGTEPEDIRQIMEGIFTRDIGELRVYPEFRDRKTGRVPMTYTGFRPGVGHHHRNGVDYIGLTFGHYSSLVKWIDDFDMPVIKEIRGVFWKGKEWKRYDEHSDVLFP